MGYEKLLIKIAELNKTTPQKVKDEIEEALEQAEIDLKPEILISVIAEKLSETIYSI